ncbi:MAG: hypothetical protein U1E35_02575 [Rhodospirillales bacterium]
MILAMCCIGISSYFGSAAAQTEEAGPYANNAGLLAATPQVNSIKPAEVSLPENTPDYFRKIFPLYMSAPLPSKIYNQGGFPKYVPGLENYNNPLGAVGSYQPKGSTQTAGNAFFQSLGTNGRACITCHQPPSGMSVSVRNIKARLNATGGKDPIFAPVDGANCPNQVREADTSEALYGGQRGSGTKDFRQSHSLLIEKGLFRIFLPVKNKANGGDIEVTVVSDPTTCNLDPAYNRDAAGRQIISVFRRPLMSANLDFKTTTGTAPPVPPVTDNVTPSGNVMWDGRERDLFTQAVSATMGHAQATKPPTQAQLQQMVAFERGIFSAQVRDKQAGILTAYGATGGPVALSRQQPGKSFNGPPFNEFPWGTRKGLAARQSIARGQAIFNTRTFTVDGVRGFNTVVGDPSPNNTCATCHNVNHAGTDVFRHAQRDVGSGTHAAFGGPAKDLPIFKVRCTAGKIPLTGSDTLLTNDPGLAVITGKCADIGAVTVPGLRAMAAREPYFHDGSAKTLTDVVNIYNARFRMGLSAQEKQDLAAFLGAL